jgi:hypothetical protein
MTSLKSCLEKLNQTRYPNGTSDLWMVSAEQVNWNGERHGYGIPTELFENSRNWATDPINGITGDGFLFVFAEYTPDRNRKSIFWVDNGIETKRRRVKCDTLYICQVSKTKVYYYLINTGESNFKYDQTKWK